MQKPLTLEQAKHLRPGDILYHTTDKNADGTPTRWKVNGQVKTWKKDPNRIYIPLKHGLRSYDYLTETYFPNGVCTLVSLQES
jgi:hypothetical protein